MSWRLGCFLRSSSLMDAADLLGTSKLDLWLRALVASFNCLHQKSGSLYVKSVRLHANDDKYQANEN